MNNIKFFRNLFLILFTSPLFSQLSSDECLEQLSIFAESAKIKNYQAAYEPWKTVLDNCPKLSLATYQYGEIILKDFIKKSEFKELIAQDELLEYAEVFDNFYGSSKTKVQNFIKNKKNVLFDIDWQGTQQIRKKIDKKNLITFFILPPSKKTLINRLSERENNNINIVKQRMAKFESDVTNWVDYDYVVINDNLEICLEEILNVIDLKINNKEIIFDKVTIEKHIQSLIS